MYSHDSIISTVSIKRTVWNSFHMTLLNVPYDLKTASGKNKCTVSIKRTVSLSGIVSIYLYETFAILDNLNFEWLSSKYFLNLEL